MSSDFSQNEHQTMEDLAEQKVFSMTSQKIKRSSVELDGNPFKRQRISDFVEEFLNTPHSSRTNANAQLIGGKSNLYSNSNGNLDSSQKPSMVMYGDLPHPSTLGRVHKPRKNSVASHIDEIREKSKNVRTIKESKRYRIAHKTKPFTPQATLKVPASLRSVISAHPSLMRYVNQDTEEDLDDENPIPEEVNTDYTKGDFEMMTDQMEENSYSQEASRWQMYCPAAASSPFTSTPRNAQHKGSLPPNFHNLSLDDSFRHSQDLPSQFSSASSSANMTNYREPFTRQWDTSNHAFETNQHFHKHRPPPFDPETPCINFKPHFTCSQVHVEKQLQNEMCLRISKVSVTSTFCKENEEWQSSAVSSFCKQTNNVELRSSDVDICEDFVDSKREHRYKTGTDANDMKCRNDSRLDVGKDCTSVREEFDRKPDTFHPNLSPIIETSLDLSLHGSFCNNYIVPVIED